MINEFFIDRCITCCLKLDWKNQNVPKLIESINYIFKWIGRENPDDYIPIEFKDKYDLAFYLSEHRIKLHDFDIEEFLNGLSNGKFHAMISMLRLKYDTENLKESEVDSFFILVMKQRKLCDLIKGKTPLIEKLNLIDAGMLQDDDEILNEWEGIINRLYTQLMDVKKVETMNDVSYIDIMEDDYSPVMEKLRHQSDKTDSLKTGYSKLDNILPAGGFEPTRLYLIGGTSGVGKSTFLANILANSTRLNEQSIKDKTDVYLYITAENLIDETLERLYCILTGNSQESVKRKYLNPAFSLKPGIVNELKGKGCTIKIFYVTPKKTTVQDIENVMNNIMASDKYNLKGVFVDYLDLIRSGQNILERRHELGEVTLGLKDLAVAFRVPIVTVTQLNKGGYSNEEASLTYVSESMQKIDNSDAVFFLRETQEKNVSVNVSNGSFLVRDLLFSVMKNRNGAKDVHINLISISKNETTGEDLYNFKIQQKDDPIEAKSINNRVVELKNIHIPLNTNIEGISDTVKTIIDF